MNVLWTSFDLIAREISAKDQKCRNAELHIANYKEKAGRFVNPVINML
jgi:hypothetical protein